MGIVNLKFRNHNIQFECDNEERVITLSERLKKKIENFSNIKGATDTKLMFLVALMLEDEVDNLSKELEQTKVQLDEESESNNDVLCDTLNYVAEYLENIAER
ncbi:hypothetical protein I862_01635 [endosymbiont of Acanthamoeba sp. UWC8]|uniref:cell division protein ZapA n=1 Tax=endosymbiont of Acanthamoeba sp. UWC8 TaxID=86106 RepID=UPI0004D1DFF8|nr:cell division protein ZapA [endosymbiont of Acanthamoeba sp. UWC8]AIF80890.1 hypothetical protein I862_01635 [endosymbiont of Acanthamoeba sp. UWC8]